MKNFIRGMGSVLDLRGVDHNPHVIDLIGRNRANIVRQNWSRVGNAMWVAIHRAIGDSVFPTMPLRADIWEDFIDISSEKGIRGYLRLCEEHQTEDQYADLKDLLLCCLGDTNPSSEQEEPSESDKSIEDRILELLAALEPAQKYTELKSELESSDSYDENVYNQLIRKIVKESLEDVSPSDEDGIGEPTE
jgi:hypothetical protein